MDLTMRIDQLAAPQLSEFWSLREDTEARFDGEEGSPILLRTHIGELPIERPSPALGEALRRMQLGPVLLGNVVPGFPGYDVPREQWNDASRELLDALAGLHHLVVRTLAVGAIPLLSVVPLGRRAQFRPRPLPSAPGVRLARDAMVRRHGGDLVLRSPRSECRVDLHWPDAAQLLLHLEGDGDETAVRLGLLPQVLRAVRAYLSAAGMLEDTEYAAHSAC